MAKYGTFMTPDLFGSKFFMGTVIKKYEENPLHFLMGERRLHLQVCHRAKTRQILTNPTYDAPVPGVWGSAFSILFNRVLGVKDTAGGSTMEEELGKSVIVIFDWSHTFTLLPSLLFYLCIKMNTTNSTANNSNKWVHNLIKTPRLTYYIYVTCT